MNTLNVAALALALAPLSSLAVAHDVGDENVPQTTVSYADLNLSTDQGVRVLNRRVRAAAVAVCARQPTAWTQAVQQKNCEIAAVKNAQSQFELALRGTDSKLALASKPKTILVR